MADELADLIGQNMKEQKAIKATQGLEPGTISSYFVFGNYKFQIRVTKILIETQNIGGESLIWGNQTFGIWNSFKWGDTTTTSFILGNSLAGVLGTNKLGTQSSSYETVEEVILNQTIPTIARYEIAKWLAGESADKPSYLALGTDSTAYDSSDTTLGSEIARKSVSYDIDTDKTVEYQIEILTTETEYHSDTFREVGLLNASSNGDLFARGIISSLQLDQATNCRITITHELKNTSIGNSMVTTAGLNLVRNWLGSSATSLTHMAWGTGTTALSASDTTLEGEQQRNAITLSRVNNVITMEGILAKDEAIGQDITKVGLFNASSSGTLFSQTKFGAINKTALFQVFETDKLTIE
jgi:hypothetical protein